MSDAQAEVERIEEALREQTRAFRALQGIAVSVNQAAGIDEALRACLADVCDFAGWPVGHAFKLAAKSVTNGVGPHLVSTQIWHHDVDHEDLYDLRRETEEIKFLAGVGLPGRCLETHCVEWTVDLPADAPRDALLARLGLCAGPAVPVVVNGEVVAVLEFFLAAPSPSPSTEPLLLELLEYMAMQLGWLWNRRRARRDALLAREHAELKSRARRELLAGLGQELYSPLRTIADLAGHLGVAAEQGRGASAGDLRRIQSISRNALASLRQVLDLPKLETGAFELELSTFEVRQMVDELVHAVLPLAQETQNTVGVRCAGALGVMHSDQAKIRLSLYSLLHNACTLSRRATITLGITRQSRAGGEHLVFTVTDTCGGMPAEQVSEVFDAAVGVETAALYRYGGSGLGLAVARNCCRALRGDLTVVSQPGAGSTFVVWFPADAEAEPNATEVRWTPRERLE